MMIGTLLWPVYRDWIEYQPESIHLADPSHSKIYSNDQYLLISFLLETSDVTIYINWINWFHDTVIWLVSGKYSFKGQTYKGVQADILSLGVILFIFKFGAPPFNRASPTDRNFGIFLRKNECFWKMHPSVKKYIAKNGPLD